ncbi:MBL fold metallo-hydrolase RNA specificity domain-containing protein [Streptomyces sp. NPDC097704]|uniref:MBL fold metallo-hydrolase RNA specificity domain-containing protein n=1 Tax=Streptomyces sp. NPDC097704 TaxID=3157101 RepID=UPI00333415A1
MALAPGDAALGPEPFLAARTVQESIGINSARGPAVIVGFAAAGTRARDLVDGARVLKMFGEYVPVRAEVADVPHFSAHADADQIVDWLRTAPPPHTTYLVRGAPRPHRPRARLDGRRPPLR